MKIIYAFVVWGGINMNKKKKANINTYISFQIFINGNGMNLLKEKLLLDAPTHTEHEIR